MIEVTPRELKSLQKHGAKYLTRSYDPATGEISSDGFAKDAATLTKRLAHPVLQFHRWEIVELVGKYGLKDVPAWIFKDRFIFPGG